MKTLKLLVLVLLITCCQQTAISETTEVFKKSFSKISLSGVSQVTCIEEHYSQVGSYDRLNKAISNTPYLEVVHGISSTPAVFNLTITKDSIFLSNDNYQIIERGSDTILAITQLKASVGALATLLLDLSHGTLIYSKIVSKGIMGNRVVTFIAKCKADDY